MIVMNVEKKEKNSAAFQVEVSAADFEEALQKAYLKNKNKINVQGFRKGKAPRKVIEGMYGENCFYDDAIEEISPKAFEFAVEAEGLKAVGRPSCTDAQVGETKNLVLSFETALYPVITLGQYKGLEVPREDSNITDADVDKYLEQIRKRNGRQSVAERPAKLGDTANIDFEGFLNGEPFDGGKGQGHKLELGAGQFIPGFEDGVVGMSAGDEKDIDLVFPEDYHTDLAGKAVVFKVKVNEVIQTELPEVDDEFAKDVSEFDNLAEYREAIMEELVKSREKAVSEDFAYVALEKAIENMGCEIPEAMIDERLSQMIIDYDRNLMARGMRLEEYMRMSGMDPASFSAMLRPQAEQQVKADILLKAVAEAEVIQVTQEDLDKAVEEIAEMYKVPVEQIKASVPVESMEEDMKKKKANDLIVESAVPVAPAPTEEKEAE